MEDPDHPEKAGDHGVFPLSVYSVYSVYSVVICLAGFLVVCIPDTILPFPGSSFAAVRILSCTHGCEESKG
jgi:hypothetical protein